MFKMIRHHLRRHTYKIVVGVPIVVLLASSLSLMRDPDEVCIVPADNRYVSVGERVTLEVVAQADEPINVVAAQIALPTQALSLEEMSKEGSFIDLWSEEPREQDGTIHFSGGVTDAGGFIGTGTVLTLTVVPTAVGEATVALGQVQMLAHDGTGRAVECSARPVTLMVREQNTPSPDVNNDRSVNMFDLGLVSANILLGYKPLYDLNNDGKVSMSDAGIVLATIKRSAGL
jgi:hypothetical protein